MLLPHCHMLSHNDDASGYDVSIKERNKKWEDEEKLQNTSRQQSSKQAERKR